MWLVLYILFINKFIEMITIQYLAPDIGQVFDVIKNSYLTVYCSGFFSLFFL